MRSLDNKVAVIAGGARRLGLAIAQVVAREGAAVVIASRSIRSVDQAVQLLKQLEALQVRVVPSAIAAKIDE